MSTGRDSPVKVDWSIEVSPFMIIPSVGMLSPGSTFIISPISIFSTGILFSLPFLIIVAVWGVSFTSSSIRPCVFVTVYSSKNPPIAMIVAISPAANTSPMIIDAMIANDTSTSAFKSNPFINPSKLSLNIGIPQRSTAIQEI